MTAGTAAILCVVLPAAAAVLGLATGGRGRAWAQEFAVIGGLATVAAAVAESVAVARDGPRPVVTFLGSIDTGSATVGLDLRADSLSATVAVAVAVVAACVQAYSTGYLPGAGTPEAPTRYPAYAATVSLFTAAMMLVVHAGDLLLLLIGWEVMGLASYLLVGHHSERPAARAAAVKAFLVTRVGDLGVLLAAVVLLAKAGTTSIAGLVDAAESGRLGAGTLSAAAVLLLAGAAGKSAQFPLHTWLPDAMEGPTPVSALIHAATMVAAGVFLVARLLPVYLAAPGALDIAAVIASVSMLGAALAALAQEDLKRLLAWSTISQVAYMLAGVAVARDAAGSAPGIAHLLSHAAFKALLFLVAGVVILRCGSALLADLGGLRAREPRLAWLLGLGLAGLAGLPPLGGFWSKEAVLAAAVSATEPGAAPGVAATWAGWLVLLAGLATALVTGLYCGRVWAVVALGTPPAGPPDPAPSVPRSMTWPLYVLAAPTVALGVVSVRPPQALAGLHLDLTTVLAGTLVTVAGLAWAGVVPRSGERDLAAALPARVRTGLLTGYGLDAVQRALVVAPVRMLARAVEAADRDGGDALVRGVAAAANRTGRAAARAQQGLATAYAAWLLAGAVVVGVVGVVLT